MSERPSGWDHDPEAEPSPYAPTQVPPTQASPYGPGPYAPTEVARPYPPTQAGSPYQPTHANSPYDQTQASSPYDQTRASSPYDQTRAASPQGADAGAGRPQDLVRYGPGVPPSEAPAAGLTAEHVWRTGRPERTHRRPPRFRRLAGAALTVILLAASGVLLYMRFHHAPFHVTGTAITERTANGCGVDVTGRIDTNGAAGTVHYQWVFQPDPNPPQPLSLSVTSGQHAVTVTVAVQGSGHGTAAQKVTLQVLGPDRAAASADVTVSCG
jgi:hypothetical protein